MRIKILISVILLSLTIFVPAYAKKGKSKMTTTEYGKAIFIKEKTSLEFSDFTLIFVKESKSDSNLTTASASSRSFEVKEKDGKTQTLTVSFGQAPPAPVSFKAGDKNYTLHTYEYPKGERLFPDKVLVQKND